MTCLIEVKCPNCNLPVVGRHGKGRKGNQRWLWLAIDHATEVVLTYVFEKRKDDVFRQLQTLLEPFGINRYYSDDWGAYEGNITPEKHVVGKRNTQKIERKNLNFRTWIKRLASKEPMLFQD